MIGFRFVGPDAAQRCMTCEHWRLGGSKLKGAGKCAIATEMHERHSYPGPNSVCDRFSKATLSAINKRKALL